MFKILLIVSLCLASGCQKDRITGEVSGIGIVEWETKLDPGESVFLNGEHFGPSPVSGWKNDSPCVVDMEKISELRVKVTALSKGHAIITLALENGGEDISNVYVGGYEPPLPID